MTKRMGVKSGSVGDNGGSAVGKRDGSSTMASYLPKKKKKTDGQFFGRRKSKL